MPAPVPKKLIIIGAGTAGLTAMKTARRHTDDVLLIDKKPHGTLCARAGCMPSKALLHAARTASATEGAEETGVFYPESPRIDGAAVMRRVRELRDNFVSHVIDGFDAFGDAYIEGEAVIEEDRIVRVNGAAYRAEKIILAPGTAPRVPGDARAGFPGVITSEELFELPAPPKRAAVLGAGAIGLEITFALSRLGVETALFHKGTSPSGVTDKEIGDMIFASLGKRAKIFTGEAPEITSTDKGEALLHCGGEAFTADILLAAAGRVSCLNKQALAAAGYSNAGGAFPEIDPLTCAAGATGLYVAGDANGMRTLQHEAADDGRRAALHALGIKGADAPRMPALAIIFTEPGYASIGEPALRYEEGYVTGEATYEDQGRAKIERKTEGKIAVTAERGTGVLRGAEIFAHAAEHSAHYLALAVQQKMTVSALLNTPFYHPVFEENIRTALRRAQKGVTTKSA